MERTPEQTLHPGALTVSVLCAAAYDGLQASTGMNARSFFWYGLGTALLTGVLLRLFYALSVRDGGRRVCAGLCSIACAFGAALTAVRAFSLWGALFPGSAGWLVLFFLLAVFWRPGAHALDCTGWVLRWGFLLAAALLLTGVWSQLRWQRLDLTLQTTVDPGSLLRLRPEYLAVPFLSPVGSRRCHTLPLVDAAVRFGFLFLTELVFGAALAQQLQQGELLRAWGMGIFSRSDTLLLTVWLMLAVYRVLVLCHLARSTAALVRERGRSAA